MMPLPRKVTEWYFFVRYPLIYTWAHFRITASANHKHASWLVASANAIHPSRSVASRNHLLRFFVYSDCGTVFFKDGFPNKKHDCTIMIYKNLMLIPYVNLITLNFVKMNCIRLIIENRENFQRGWFWDRTSTSTLFRRKVRFCFPNAFPRNDCQTQWLQHTVSRYQDVQNIKIAGKWLLESEKFFLDKLQIRFFRNQFQLMFDLKIKLAIDRNMDITFKDSSLSVTKLFHTLKSCCPVNL